MTAQVGPEPGIHYESKPEGPISAAVIAGGVGSATLGLLTTLSEASTTVADRLKWSEAVGPLSGKTILAVVAWLVAWLVLHLAMRTSAYETRRALAIGLALVGLGVVGTFPTFFQLFG